MVKGILKRYTRSTASRSAPSSEGDGHDSHDESPQQKRVSFDGPEPVKVFEADEWDRSPAAVTLKLTYKDVVELRELNISLVKPGPLAMARTPSRRPSDRRAAVTRSPPSAIEKSIFSANSSPAPLSPSFGSTNPSGYQYHSFSSQSLSPLLEDALSPLSSPTPVARPTRPNVAHTPEATLPASGSPPGLPTRTPLLKGLGSPALPPPSPLLLSPASSRPPSPKPAATNTSNVPLYRHPWARNRGVLTPITDHNGAETPVPIVLPNLGDNMSLSEDLKLDKLALETDDDETEEDWKPFGLLGLDVEPGRDADEAGNSFPPTPVVTRKAGRGLMGWEFKRSSNAYGKLGFGLVRKA